MHVTVKYYDGSDYYQVTVSESQSGKVVSFRLERDEAEALGFLLQSMEHQVPLSYPMTALLETVDELTPAADPASAPPAADVHQVAE